MFTLKLDSEKNGSPKNTISRLRLLAAVGLLVVTVFTQAMAAVLEGRVVSVADGDTLTVLDHASARYIIRLSGIDAPEKTQPWGDASKRYLISLVAGRQVRVEWHKRDRYGRVIGTVYCDGQDVSLEQLKAGLAWHYRRYASEQPANERSRYAETEAKAHEQEIGLWSDPAPVPPWEHRRRLTSRPSPAGPRN